MRVALVSEHASPLAPLGGVDAGGQNVHVASLARTLARHGAEVVVYTRRDDPEPPERVPLEPGVEVCHVDAGAPRPISKDELWPHMGAFACRLRERLSAQRPDVVHAHFWMSGHAALEAAGPLRVPVVQTFHALGVVKRRHQGERDTSPAERIEVEREVLRRADHVVATCTDEVFELVRMGASSTRVTVIPSGVDLGLFGPHGPAEPRARGRARVVCVGRLVERKGIGNVISALAALPSAELVVAGGPERARLGRDAQARRLQVLAREHGVAGRVELRGRVRREDLPALLRSADALVSVPWYEPFGITPLEAMACGVPVLAAAVGGLIDTVVDGRTGVHVPPRDPERLAAELGRLLRDGRRRERYGRAGVERTRRLYDWDRLATATLGLYERVAGKRPRAAGVRPRGRRAPAAAALPPAPAEHVRALQGGLVHVERALVGLELLGRVLARRLAAGARLLVAGNGGSAAQAQHLAAELVGRCWCERGPLSAVCLHAETSSLTAIANDYGGQHVFARQVRAHGRPGDVLLLISTSGESANVIAAGREARASGIEVWTLTGAAPNPLAALADEAIALPGESAATVQELHLVALHALCAALDRELALDPGAGASRESHAGPEKPPRVPVAATGSGRRAAKRRPAVTAGREVASG